MTYLPGAGITIDPPNDAWGGAVIWDGTNAQWISGYRDAMNQSRNSTALTAAGFREDNTTGAKTITEGGAGVTLHVDNGTACDWHQAGVYTNPTLRYLNVNWKPGRRVYAHISGIDSVDGNGGNLTIAHPTNNNEFCHVQLRRNGGNYEVYMGDSGGAVGSGVVNLGAAGATKECWVAATRLGANYWVAEHYVDTVGNEPGEDDWTNVGAIGSGGCNAPYPHIAMSGASFGANPGVDAIFQKLNVPR